MIGTYDEVGGLVEVVDEVVIVSELLLLCIGVSNNDQK